MKCLLPHQLDGSASVLPVPFGAAGGALGDKSERRDPSPKAATTSSARWTVASILVSFVWRSSWVAERLSGERGASLALSSRLDNPSKRAFSSIDSDR
jgi:hypothetical protein